MPREFRGKIELDDVGFGAPSALGGLCQTSNLECLGNLAFQ